MFLYKFTVLLTLTYVSLDQGSNSTSVGNITLALLGEPVLLELSHYK